jgi:hypothetical protein
MITIHIKTERSPGSGKPWFKKPGDWSGLMFITVTCTHDHSAALRHHYQLAGHGQLRSWELGPIKNWCIGAAFLRTQSYTLLCRIYTVITLNPHVKIVITVEHHRTEYRAWRKSVVSQYRSHSLLKHKYINMYSFIQKKFPHQYINIKSFYFAADAAVYSYKHRQRTYNLTLWHVRIMFIPPRLSWEPVTISLEDSDFTAFCVTRNDKPNSGPQVKFLKFMSDLTELEFSRHIGLNISNIKFHKNPSSRANGQTLRT